MHVRASSRVQALDCAAPAGPSDFAAGLIRLSLSLMGKLTMNTSSSHTMSSPAGAAPVPPTWLFVLLAAGVLVWPLVEAAKNRSEEHTSELQSRLHLVCRLLLEK